MPPGLKKWDLIPPCANLTAIVALARRSHFNGGEGHRLIFVLSGLTCGGDVLPDQPEPAGKAWRWWAQE